MKNHILVLSVVLLFCLPAIAQKEQEQRNEKMEAKKIAFITHHLDLSPEEAQKFWPVYNQYKNEKNALVQNLQKERAEQKEGKDLSDKEIEERIIKEMELEQKRLDLKKEYYSKFKQVLPVKKVAAFYKTERGFSKMQNHGKKQKAHPGHLPNAE